VGDLLELAKKFGKTSALLCGGGMMKIAATQQNGS
jgi:hypothetical protein